MLRNIIFASGGIKGLCFLGCIKALEERNAIQSIKVFVGCSVGAIVATLLSVGYTSSELMEIALHLDFSEYKDINTDNILGFFETFGIDNGQKLMNLFSICLKQKTRNPNITFLELFQQTQKKLIIYGTCLNDQSARVFSYETTPNMSIIEAVRISISIPLFYTMCNYQNQSYVDGAIASTYPIEMFKDELDCTLGFYFNNPIQYIEQIDTIEKYIKAILNSFYRVLEKQIIGKYKPYTVLLQPKVETLHFNLNPDEKKEMFEHGYMETIKYFHKKQFQKCLAKIV